MKRESASTLRTITTAAVTVALATVPWASGLADAPQDVVIRSIAFDGDRVVVGLTNFDANERRAILAVDARLDSGERATALVEITVPPFSDAAATAPMDDDVREVVAVGIVLDDGVAG